MGLDDGFLQEGVGLLLPDPDALAVENTHQDVEIRGAEAAQEVAGGGGVGDALGAQDVEVGFVVAEQLQILKAGAASQEVGVAPQQPRSEEHTSELQSHLK